MKSKISSSAVLGTEDEVLRRIKNHVFKPVKGGHQLNKIYISPDLAVCCVRRRSPIWWDDSTLSRLERVPVINKIYALLRRQNWPGMFHLKQLIKHLLAILRGDPKAGPFAMLTTLKNYQLATQLDGIVDPFLLMDRVEIRTKYRSKVIVAPAIVREECGQTLYDELCATLRAGDTERAKKRILEAIAIDERTWAKRVFNVDFSFKNYRSRNGKIVLRDAGHVLNHYDHIVKYIHFLQDLDQQTEVKYNPILKNTTRLALFNKPLSDFYRQKALQVYSVENLSEKWGRGVTGKSTSPHAE